jgi:tetratricopeptide (TPR) repeat protein
MAKKPKKPIVPTGKPTSATPLSGPAGPVLKNGSARPPEEPPATLRHFFTPEDWIAAITTFLISGAAFFYTMSPEVTMEDSGELVTGAFNFGVPHPPGYPLWAFLGWMWRHLVPFGNPAWRIGLLSVLTGAMVVGVLTLLMTRSVLMLLRSVSWANEIEERMKHWIALTVGASMALLFGFNRGVWLWACVPEMRVLNVFMFILTSCVFFAWMMRPDRYAFLYATILLYALGITNHQTIVVMVVPFMVGALAVGLLSVWNLGEPLPRLQQLISAVRAFWELIVAALFSWSIGSFVYAWLQAPDVSHTLGQNIKVPMFLLFGSPKDATLLVFGPAGAAVLLLIWFGAERWLSPRRALICTAAFLIGCSFYLYMPISASTNPPMNWGFAATKQGFLHEITRGQYEKLNIASPLSRNFYLQIMLFTRALKHQYSAPLCLLGIVTLVLLVWQWRNIGSRGRSWLIFVWAAFFTTSFGLLTIINPGLDKQNQEINLKFFAPAHGFFAMLIGYGIALLIAAALVRWKTLPAWKPLPPLAVRAGSVLLFVLPIIPLTRNWATCEQRGHDFGYQFGYRMFYPGGDYPPMEQDAVLFGGTDPGRFVPTYMIFCESRVDPKDRYHDPHLPGGENFDRRDVYIITQNALADNTYMNYIRDHYDYSRPCITNEATLTKFVPWQRAMFRWGWTHLHRDTMYPRDPIYIPTEMDLQKAFQEYVENVKERQKRGEQIGTGEQVMVDDAGRVSVRGVEGVMNINGILTKWIFERNKAKHAFYVEESYVIPWMYDYLTPAGAIMKINRDPMPTAQQGPEVWAQIVARDTAYWDKLCAEFKARPEFHRDSDAQKTFSKLRSAIGGLYANRRMVAQAEHAFRQARDLCPESPEANFRLAQLYMELNQLDDAIRVLQDLQKLDPLNQKIGDAINQLQGSKQARSGLQQLEQSVANSPRDINLIGQLASAYFKIGQRDKIIPLCENYLKQPNLSANDMMQIAQMYVSLNQADHAMVALQKIISQYPQEAQAYYAVSLILGVGGRTNEAFDALGKAIQLNPAFRDKARNDPQFGSIRNDPRFQKLLNP